MDAIAAGVGTPLLIRFPGCSRFQVESGVPSAEQEVDLAVVWEGGFARDFVAQARE